MIVDSILLVLLFTTGVHSFNIRPIEDPHESDLRVYALPVGQGDCTIIQCPNFTGRPGTANIIIFDCGSSSKAGISSEDVNNFFVRKSADYRKSVRYVIISHGDQDHYNYVHKIVFPNLKAVIIGGNRDDYNHWLDQFDNDKLYLVNNGEKCIGNCVITKYNNRLEHEFDFCENENINFDILAANVNKNSNNEKSIVLKIVHRNKNNWSMLLSGDMEGQASQKIAKNVDVTSTVYKVSHHGASSKARDEWTNAIKPQHAFISSAYNFGNCRHPRCETISKLRMLHTTNYSHEIYCWDGDSKSTMNYNTTQSIYETSPTEKTICFLTYSSERASESPVTNCGLYITPECREKRPRPDDDCT